MIVFNVKYENPLSIVHKLSSLRAYIILFL